MIPPADRSALDLRLARIRERIAAAAARAGRDPDEIHLLAASKGVSPEIVAAAAGLGVRRFGENYVQEARAKIPAVAALLEGGAAPLPEWHLIGPLQTNKAKYCPALFHVVESIDNLAQAQELARVASKQGNTKLRVLIEVNLSTEPGRAGVLPAQALDLCAEAGQIPNLVVDGLMGMAPVGPDAEAARPHFRDLRRLWERLPAGQRRTLSMGMSGDFEVAVEEGATLVRLGTALFGLRQSTATVKAR